MAEAVNLSRLRSALEASAATQSKIAESLGISKQLITHWVQGRREPSPEQLRALAKELGVDATYLTGTLAPTETTAATEGLESLSSAVWAFRRAPEDGGRDYGNANVLAFTPDINTLVRELGQNALDQVLPSVPGMHLRFNLIELRRPSASYAAFVDGMKLAGLLPHLDAAIKQNSRLSSKLRRGLAGVERLLLLLVEDFACTGAYGAETTSDEPGVRNPFAALVRDNLNSSKETNSAGGTHGAGKGTAWQCSDLSTVLIGSRVAEAHLLAGQPEGAVRFIAKSELTWHQWTPEDGPRAGPGWLARPGSTSSMWLAPTELKPLFLDRADIPKGIDPSTVSGTSLLIIGFRDPQEDEASDTDAILGRLQQAAAENFFPAILEGRMTVSVEHHVDGTRTRQEVVDPAKYVPEMVEAYNAHMEDELVPPDEAAPGDTTHDHITHLVPKTREDANPRLHQYEDLEARCDLVVRFAKADELAPPGAGRRSLLNHVAMIRGRRMVVEYKRLSNLVVGGRPFHGLVLGGEAAGDSIEQAAAEQLLRLAEPPAHNKWMWREDVRDNYRTGAKQCLNELFQRITERLRDVIKPLDEATDDGPEELRRLLFLAGPVRTTALAVIRLSEQALEGSSWRIAGEIVINDRKRPLVVAPTLSVVPESGSVVDLELDSLVITKATRGTPVVTPDLNVKVPAGTTRLTFEARSRSRSDGLDLTRCRVSVRVAARVDQLEVRAVAALTSAAASATEEET